MRIPSLAEVDAFCGCPSTRYQRIAQILAPALLLGSVAYILIVWHRLPAQIPIHYNGAGEIDGCGGKGVLLFMPLFGLLTELVLSLSERFPKSWNTGVRVTVLNKARVYRLVRDLMADLRLVMALLFGGFGLYLSTMPERFSSAVPVLLALLILLPLLRYLIRLRRAK